ncbi:hypothetical protein J1N35_018913 [Gossypium stocksii]|uniref:RNase H type-1 domain-containing protein n=1 Tax=Gossypium stocksii TaxID=47602 RepID=A0A9D3VPY2_9ROSI|nr:hypothetical protein J1N35_018913 [Gossypium stocksii]
MWFEIVDFLKLFGSRLSQGSLNTKVLPQAWTARSNLRGWWQLSNTGWAKINMDRSISRVNSRAALGGAIIGLYGGWLVGFGTVTGLTDIFQVEAKVMIEGLKLAWARGFQQVEVESDNALLVDILQNGLE